MSLIYYNGYNIFINQKYQENLKLLPGGESFSGYFKIFSPNISAVDRTNTLKFPLKVDLLPFLVMPELVEFNKSFSDICDERALFLMHKVKNTGRKLAVMYSGGVDSTTLLCSLLKNCSKKDLKDNVVVLLSNGSIYENKNFFYDHVIKYFNCVSSFKFPYYLGNDDYLFVSGENADQLFGSQVVSDFVRIYPFSDLLKNINTIEDKLINLIKIRLKSDDITAKKWYEKLKQITDAAPIDIDNGYKMLWWVNFTTKWQSVYVRMLSYSQNKDTIKLEENYTTFFSTKDFQLWSMNNSDKLIKDTTSSSKYIAKEYIYEYNGDSSYLSKPKIGSLSRLMRQKHIPMTIDGDMNYSYDFPLAEHYNYNNSFVDF